MITKSSIDLTKINEPCFALIGGRSSGWCSILLTTHTDCGTYRCPFYKPRGCKDWIRIEDRMGINLIPKEELNMEGE
jgi:hypothetical protein